MTQALKTQPRRLSFGLRTLFLAVLLAAVALGLLARNMQLAARQRQAVVALEKCGFLCSHSYGADEKGQELLKPRLPSWLISFAGRDFFYNVEFITELGITNTERIEQLSNLPHLRSFSVSDETIGDAVTPRLSDLRQLKHLQLSKCNLTDAGLEHLRGLTGLEDLSLSENPFTGAGLIHLCDSRALKSLLVDSTDFDDRGMRCLAQLTNLEELSIENSPDVTDQGLAFLAQKTSMRTLSIIGTGISDEGLAHLKNMRGIDGLSLANNPHIGGAGLVHLEQMSQLNVLNLTGCGLSDDGLSHIGRLASVTLYLGGSQITGAGLAHLESFPRLHTLYLTGTNLDEAGLSHLSRVTTLKGLILDGCEIRGTGLNALSQLTFLDLSKVTITDSVVAGLLPLQLEGLKLDNTNIDDAGLERLTAMRSLVFLTLHGCAIGDSAVPILKRFPRLETVYVDEGTFSKAGIKDLKPIDVP